MGKYLLPIAKYLLAMTSGFVQEMGQTSYVQIEIYLLMVDEVCGISAHFLIIKPEPSDDLCIINLLQP